LPSEVPSPPSLRGSLAVPVPLFELEVTEDRDEIVIRVRGELDLAERPRLDHALANSEAGDARRILLELDELTFIDAAGLHCLEAASSRSAESGSRMRMTRGTGNVAAILHLTALDLTLPFLEPR
jgi:anti-sigma B factor antagonist